MMELILICEDGRRVFYGPICTLLVKMKSSDRAIFDHVWHPKSLIDSGDFAVNENGTLVFSVEWLCFDRQSGELAYHPTARPHCVGDWSERFIPCWYGDDPFPGSGRNFTFGGCAYTCPDIRDDNVRWFLESSCFGKPAPEGRGATDQETM